MGTYLDVLRKSGELVEVYLSGLVCVLTRREGTSRWEKTKLTKRLIRSFTVSVSKATKCHE